MIDVLFILAMALVTFVPRYLPFALASRLRLPAQLEKALHYVPIAVLTVIIVQTMLFKKGQLMVTLDNAYIWAGLMAFLVALVQQRLFVTIGCGLATYAILKFWLFG